MKTKIRIVLLFISIYASGQDYKKKTRYLFGTFQTQNTTINGVSLGLFSTGKYVKTNGIRLEVPGIGFIAFMANNSLIPNNETTEIVNGINISSGTIENISYNGITLALVVQNGTVNNGLAIAGMWNAMGISNGVQISILLNEATTSKGVQIAFGNSAKLMKGIQIGVVNTVKKKMKGIQIGIYNKSKKTKGFQIGLWNVNEKRKLPLLNWKFKKDDK